MSARKTRGPSDEATLSRIEPAEHGLFTYYCWDHREQVRRALSPTSGPWGRGPRVHCPVCFERMYWVPNGGTVVPPMPEVRS